MSGYHIAAEVAFDLLLSGDLTVADLGDEDILALAAYPLSFAEKSEQEWDMLYAAFPELEPAEYVANQSYLGWLAGN